jgi:competence protein ComEC
MSVALKSIVVGGVVCAGAGWYVAGGPVAQTRLTFLAVGQGDCTVLQHQGATILIDAAPSVTAAKWEVLPKLRALGVRDVQWVLLTHPDMDHVAGVPVLARTFPSAQFAISEEFRDHEDWQRLVSEWKLPESRIAYLPHRLQGTLGDLRIDVLCPDIWSPKQDNDGSAFVKIVLGQGSAVLSGDASAEAEIVAASEGDWSAEIMKAGHHGSRTSTSWTWLREVKPSFAVISCGKDNRYGHPHKEVLERIDSMNIDLRRTDEGDVSFIFRNGRFELDR